MRYRAAKKNKKNKKRKRRKRRKRRRRKRKRRRRKRRRNDKRVYAAQNPKGWNLVLDRIYKQRIIPMRNLTNIQ